MVISLVERNYWNLSDLNRIDEISWMCSIPVFLNWMMFMWPNILLGLFMTL